VKAEFPGYFPLSERASQSAWKDGVFSFDASVLLDLYRYSDDTRQELLKLLKSLGDRLWITRQAAQEFLDGRLAVIASQSKKYEENIAALDALEASYKSSRGHPFLTKQLLAESETLFKKLRAFLNGKKSQLDQLVSKDPIQEEIAKLLSGRIGNGFSTKQLQEIFATGEERYKNKIPPGYEDAKKPEGNNRFGDLLIWLELIEKVRVEKKVITFVTADEKEDWWRISRGKTIGPRPELVAELKEKAGVELQMFSPERFMTVAAEKLSQDVKPTAIEEVKEVRRATLSPGVMAALQTLEAVAATEKHASGLPDAYQQFLKDQERLDALRKQATALPDAYQQILKDHERIAALQNQVNPAADIYQQILKDQERIAALQKQINPAADIYQQILKDQERIAALQKRVNPAADAYQQILKDQERIAALQKQINPAADTYHQILKEQEKLDALQKEINPNQSP
jgi:hypothetical protein